MSKVVVVATAGAGGDLQPLMSVASHLRDRGHDVVVIGDRSVERSLRPLKIETEVLPAELDLGPALSGAIRDAMREASEDREAAGPIVQQRMTAWAHQVAGPVSEAIDARRPAVLLTSLFGVEVLDAADPPCPWAVVNSTFYIGPDPPHPIEADFDLRAVPLIRAYASLLESPDLVMHATDPVFDFSHTGLPDRHHYVGPLGIWEPTSTRPSYLDDPGDPWVLVSISSQLQDDVPIAQAALTALAEVPVRVVLTLGPEHTQGELDHIPANARVEQVVSHFAVLGQARLLLSHAGHGSVMKALWRGCPMVLLPWGRDQPGVAARAAALRVADVISREEVSPERIWSAMTRVLADAGIRAETERQAARLRMTDPPAAAVELIENLL